MSTPPRSPSPASRITALKESVKATADRVQINDLSDLLRAPFCVGECHEDISPKAFLIANMNRFKAEGFDVLFMEHLSGDSEYKYEESEVKNPKSPLRKKLLRLDEGHMGEFGGKLLDEINTYTGVVAAAMEAGIKVIPLETSDENYRKNPNGESRMISLSGQAQDVIEFESNEYFTKNERPLKWIAFIGSAHLHTNYGVPGLCDLISGVESIFIGDTKGRYLEMYQIFKEPTEVKFVRIAADEQEKEEAPDNSATLKTTVALLVNKDCEMDFDILAEKTRKFSLKSSFSDLGALSSCVQDGSKEFMIAGSAVSSASNSGEEGEDDYAARMTAATSLIKNASDILGDLVNEETLKRGPGDLALPEYSDLPFNLEGVTFLSPLNKKPRASVKDPLIDPSTLVEGTKSNSK